MSGSRREVEAAQAQLEALAQRVEELAYQVASARVLLDDTDKPDEPAGRGP